MVLSFPFSSLFQFYVAWDSFPYSRCIQISVVLFFFPRQVSCFLQHLQRKKESQGMLGRGVEGRRQRREGRRA